MSNFQIIVRIYKKSIIKNQKIKTDFNNNKIISPHQMKEMNKKIITEIKIKIKKNMIDQDLSQMIKDFHREIITEIKTPIKKIMIEIQNFKQITQNDTKVNFLKDKEIILLTK